MMISVIVEIEPQKVTEAPSHSHRSLCFLLSCDTQFPPNPKMMPKTRGCVPVCSHVPVTREALHPWSQGQRQQGSCRFCAEAPAGDRDASRATLRAATPNRARGVSTGTGERVKSYMASAYKNVISVYNLNFYSLSLSTTTFFHMILLAYIYIYIYVYIHTTHTRVGIRGGNG